MALSENECVEAIVVCGGHGQQKVAEVFSAIQSGP
jgi:hypothetical protein